MKSSPQLHPSAGFSLIEILVGLFVGMLALLAVMAVYTGFESQKRSTTSGGDAQTNGALGLYTVERDARQAGMGFADIAVLNCPIRAWRKDLGSFSFGALAPIVVNPADAAGTPIFPAGDANTDLVQITFGNATGLPTGIPFTQPAPGSANYKVGTSRAGLTIGDLVIATQPGKDCSVAQVTNLPASGPGLCSTAGAGGTDVVVHNAGMYDKPTIDPATGAVVCKKTESEWNKPGGLGVDYTTGGKLFSLGSLPTSVIYAVRKGNLTVCDYMNAPCQDATRKNDPTVWVPIYSNVVSMRAQYGRDTNKDGSADTFDQTAPTNACGWARLSAVRIGIVARSTQFEKTDVTTVAPSWQGQTNPIPGGTPALKIDLSGLPDWGRYRYKTFEAVVPLRNLIWMDKTSC